MKKKLHLLILCLLCVSNVLLGQTKCATCYKGTHLQNGLVLDSTNSPSNLLSAALPVTPNGNSSLAQSFILQNVCGLNYVTGTTATSTRYSPPYSGFPATINIAGLPAACLTIKKAFLYWGASYTEATPPAVNAVVTNPALATNTYAGANVGQSGSVCWGEVGTVTYRADVTAAISGNGAYKINLTGFANAAWEVDGLTLVIIYSAPAAYTGSISIWDGCISYVGGTGTLTMNGFTACAASTTASAFMCAGDMQSNVNGNANTNTINGTTATFTNNFWNTNVINPITNLTNGQTTCVYQPYIANAGDCWFWSVAGLYWQNTSCVVCNSPLTLTTTPVNPTCGNNNGSITVGVTGGTAPYTYTWSPAVSTSASATGLSAGTYTITVKDANCNTSTVSVTLTTTSLTVTAAVTTNVKCNGAATGSVSSTVTGGTAPYTYTWTPVGGTNATATGLTAGTYTITVKDKNGCTGTASVTITQPPALTATTTVVNVKCNGGATGSATVTAGGGTPVYTYLWAPVGGTNPTASNLSAGTYTITVTDANGCTKTAITTITQPPVLTATTTTIPATCGNSNGSATVTAGGGTPAYTYSWAPVGGTNPTASNLSAGTYTITVKDANGCSVTAIAIVSNTGGETATISASTNVKCNGGNTGSATVTVVGGTPAYTYAWTPSGGTNPTASNLTAGTYTVTVKDANGCVATVSVTITQPPALTVTICATTGVSCNGGNNGSGTCCALGGTPAYTYSWAPVGGSNATASNLTAGTYTVTVKDANGCSATATATITQPPALTVVTIVVGAKCNGGASGSATVTAGGGTPVYTYSWAPVGGTNPTASNLSAGTYTVTVKDANGCSITATATITQPLALSATTTTLPATCGNSDGSATVTAGGGTPAYTYLWAPIGGTSPTASNLSAGTYTVTVTDANGCSITATAAVANLTGVTATIPTSTNVSCNGGSNGTAIVTPAGGTAPYTYNWTPFGGTNATASNLTAGTYTVTVKDANGCAATASVTLTQPTALTASVSNTPVLCNGGNTGSAIVTPGGGAPTYTYLWAPVGGTNPIASNLSAGIYTITVTDANGCSITATTNVTQPAALATVTNITANVSCNGGSNGIANVIAGGGTPTYTYLWAPVGGTNPIASNLSAGIYTVTVTDANGCSVTATATITQPAVLTATTTTTPAACGSSNGSATVTPGGGTGAYTYLWSPIGGTNPIASNLSAGIYTITLTDANGCSITATATVNNAPGETASITASTNVSCNGGSNGSATVTAVGGTLPYTYNWAPVGGTNPTASNLTAGTYTVTVKDANGCIATASVIITQPPLLTVSALVASNVSCNGGNNGSAGCIVTGGSLAYIYSWTPVGGNNANASNLTAGTYTITITDANGCTATASTTITQPPLLSLTAAGFPVSCNGGSDGSATVIPAGGTPAYTYAWIPLGGNNATASNLSAGTYTITITDAHGCSQNTAVTISQPAPIAVTFSADSLSGCAPLCVNFKDLTVDGAGIINKWNWNFGDGDKDTVKNPRHCYSNPGSYTVTLTITDNHGCTSTLVINNMITVYSFPVAAFTYGPQPATMVNSEIAFTDRSSDAYGIATWLWSFNDPLNDVPSNIQNPTHTYGDTGTYCATLTVTNVHGCVDSVTECLVISPEYTLYIPNAFSPNADGLNETFKPKGEYISDYKMYIFDRWGMMLYYTDDMTKGWNGAVNNGTKICQEDTYVYMIEVTDNLGKKHNYIGRVTLIK